MYVHDLYVLSISITINNLIDYNPYGSLLDLGYGRVYLLPMLLLLWPTLLYYFRAEVL